ncbi:hypothetical protein H5T87_09590 [bacterium]|nr:hypothetical protein [bacterium]
MRTFTPLMFLLIIFPLLGATFDFTKENYAGRSGIVLGGLGAGTVEIRPNGALEEWQVFNNTANPYQSPRSFFAIRVKEDGKPAVARILQLQHEMLPTIKRVRYRGEFPFAWLEYFDEGLPVRVQMTAFSSFIPHDYKNSALPAAFFLFKIKNSSSRKCDASLLFAVQNMVGISEGYSGPVANKLVSQKGFYGVGLGVPVGKPPAFSRPLKILVISRPAEEGYKEQLTRTLRANNLQIFWTRVENNRIVLPTNDPNKLKNDFDLIWLAETLNMSDTLGEENMRVIQEAVRLGMPFILSGGWDSFYGYSEERCGKLAGTIIEEIVPVRFKKTFDTVNQPVGMVIKDTSHPIFKNLPPEVIHIGGYNQVEGVKEGGKVLITTADGQPLLIEGRYGAGKVMVFASAVWGGWPANTRSWDLLFRQIVAYLTGSQYDSATGLPADSPTAGSMFIATNTTAYPALWDDYASLWKAFSNEGVVNWKEGRDGCLTAKMTLAPNEEKSVLFVLSWFFPNHNDYARRLIGHKYEEWFKDAEEVARYALTNYEKLYSESLAFHDAFYSTLPQWIADAINSQFTTLFKSTWWTKDGTFGVWEGMNACCGLQTTDVSYYGSFPVLLFFPELEKVEINLTARAQSPIGEIPHFFPGRFDVPDAYWRIDMEPQYILMVYRDYLWTGDKEFLKKMWPHVKKAIDYELSIDRDGDGIPNIEGSALTYDGWPMHGTSVYVASVWLAGLKAATEMGKIVGDEEAVKNYSALYNKAKESFIKELWNGEYFILYHDIATGRKDPCCMLDQMNGQWYAHMLDMGYILPKDMVKSAITACYKYNRKPVQPGMAYIDWQKGECWVNGAWPRGGATVNEIGGQWGSPWTGTEYMFASLLIYEGMVKEGLEVVKAVYDRYNYAGLTWNHIECGWHYFRPMDSLTILLALQGFHYDAPNASLTLKPRFNPQNHNSPFIVPTAWGIFSQEIKNGKQVDSLTVKRGKLILASLRLQSEKRPAKVLVEKRAKTATKIEAKFSWEDGELVLSFPKPITLQMGDKLYIEM